VEHYSRGNNFATIKLFEQKFFWYKFLVDNYSRGNDFATIKNLRPKIFLFQIFSGKLFSRK